MNADSSSNSPGSGFRLLLMVTAGILATVLAVFAVGSIGDVYPTPPEKLNLGAAPTAEERAAASAAQQAVDAGNAMVLLAVIGGIFGAVMAAAAGWLNAAGARTIVGVLAGAILAGALGCVAGNLAVSSHRSVAATMIGDEAEPYAMLMHGITWGLIGLGVGLGCGLSDRESSAKGIATSVIVGGVMGAVTGAAFPLGVAVAAPLVDASLPVPGAGAGRYLWVGLAAMLFAVGMSQVPRSDQATVAS